MGNLMDCNNKKNQTKILELRNTTMQMKTMQQETPTAELTRAEERICELETEQLKRYRLRRKEDSQSSIKSDGSHVVGVHKGKRDRKGQKLNLRNNG